MAGIPRLMVTNRIQAPATVLGASASASGSPVSRLKDQLRSKTWRSPVGHVVVAGCNDKLDFNDGSNRVATLTPGTYATPAAYATMVQTQMNVVSSTCVVSYASSKFTVARTGTLSLLWNTGANKAASCGIDLGFDVSADDTGASSYLADSVSYQSRHMLTADCGSALGDTVAIVINHNAGTGGTFTFQMDAASLAAVGYGDTSTPDFSTTLPGNADIRIAYFAEQTKRYRRLLINDVQNPLGYSEVGIWYAGPHTQPSVSYGIDFTMTPDELSDVTVAIGGAHFQDEKPSRPTWSMGWLEVPEADRAALAAAFALAPKGRNFFLSFNAVDSPTDTHYVFKTEGVPQELASGQYFNLPVALAEALG